jgi:hypothetical protein
MPFFKGLCKRLFSGVYRLGYVTIPERLKPYNDRAKRFKSPVYIQTLDAFGPWDLGPNRPE